MFDLPSCRKEQCSSPLTQGAALTNALIDARFSRSRRRRPPFTPPPFCSPHASAQLPSMLLPPCCCVQSPGRQHHQPVSGGDHPRPSGAAARGLPGGRGRGRAIQQVRVWVGKECGARVWRGGAPTRAHAAVTHVFPPPPPHTRASTKRTRPAATTRSPRLRKCLSWPSRGR